MYRQHPFLSLKNTILVVLTFLVLFCRRESVYRQRAIDSCRCSSVAGRCRQNPSGWVSKPKNKDKF